jgi:tetratricopeptide (TPR) repeat protein
MTTRSSTFAWRIVLCCFAVTASFSSNALASEEAVLKQLKLVQQQLTDLQVQVRQLQDHLGVTRTLHAELAGEPAVEAAVDPDGPQGPAAPHWAKRGDKAELQKAIDIWSKAAEDDPNDVTSLGWLARGHYLMTYGHLAKEDDRDLMLTGYKAAADFAMQGIRASSPEFIVCVEAGDPVDDCVKIVPKEGHMSLYWYAVSISRYAATDSFPTLLFYKNQVFSVMQRCLELDEDFFFGAAHRYFGAFYAKAPDWAGGDLNKSKEHFDKAIEMAPNYFGTRILMAQLYTTKVEDEDLFQELLQYVIDGDPNALPAVAPENTIDQDVAKQLLEEMEDIF